MSDPLWFLKNGPGLANADDPEIDNLWMPPTIPYTPATPYAPTYAPPSTTAAPGTIGPAPAGAGLNSTTLFLLAAAGVALWYFLKKK